MSVTCRGLRCFSLVCATIKENGPWNSNHRKRACKGWWRVTSMFPYRSVYFGFTSRFKSNHKRWMMHKYVEDHGIKCKEIHTYPGIDTRPLHEMGSYMQQALGVIFSPGCGSDIPSWGDSYRAVSARVIGAQQVAVRSNLPKFEVLRRGFILNPIRRSGNIYIFFQVVAPK